MPRNAKDEKLKDDKTKNVKTTKNTKSKITTATKETSIKASNKSAAKKNTNASKAKKDTKKTKNNVTAKSQKASSISKNAGLNSKVSSKSTKKLKNLKSSAKTFKFKKPFVLEYYDLPYNYNKTVVKALAQNPTTLFVYWEISAEDRENLSKQYGENFFYITKPVLIIHNLTEKYSYEIDINDFANNWYINVGNSKCQYVIELGRRPIEFTDKIKTDFLSISSSNVIESPNDHVLFFKDTNKVLYRNINTNKYTELILKPFLKNISSIYKDMHLADTENINESMFDFNNPSSQNPTSNVL